MDSILVCSAISACEKSSQWQMALDLVSSMSSQTEATAGYNSAISALSASGWTKSLRLFEQMSLRGLQVDLITIGATMSAFETGQWPKAFGEMIRPTQSKLIHESHVLASLLHSVDGSGNSPKSRQCRHLSFNTVGNWAI